MFQFSLSSGWLSFTPYGLNSIIASTTVVAVVTLLFSGVASAPTLRRALVLLILVAATINLVASLVLLAIGPAVLWKTQNAGFSAVISLLIFAMGIAVWFIGAARQAFRSVPHIKRPLWRAVGFVLCICLLPAALPVWPAFWPAYFDQSTPNLWELAARLRSGSDETASREKSIAEWREAQRKSIAVEAMQPRRLDAALASVAPRAPEKSNIFVIGVSGDSEEDVFQHETESSLAILKTKFATGDHALALVNAQDTTDRYPIASIQNLSFVLREIGKRMDREKDVLILTMTSHGSKDGLALIFGDDVHRTFAPETLKSLLDDAGIKNRVLIVAACFSGVFVPVLADENTMIMTAASATRTSFGCGSGRAWTYFGDAFFAHGLKQATTLAGAFSVARRTVGDWEVKQHITPSDPQISIGSAIAKRFPWLIGDVSKEVFHETLGSEPQATPPG